MNADNETYRYDGIDRYYRPIEPSRGVVDTPLPTESPKDVMKTLSPMGGISDAKDIADAVVYLTEARYVTGEVRTQAGGSRQAPQRYKAGSAGICIGLRKSLARTYW